MFLDDFKALRANYSYMDVPTKDEAMKSFKKLGGVPRYVLWSLKTKDGLEQAKLAVLHLDRTTCLKLFSRVFEEETMSDSLIHIKCSDENYDTESMFYDFASPYMQDELGKRFTKLNKEFSKDDEMEFLESSDDVVEFLESYAHKDVGSAYGYIFELVAYQRMVRGGDFLMKKVGSNGVAIVGPQAEVEARTWNAAC